MRLELDGGTRSGTSTTPTSAGAVEPLAGAPGPNASELRRRRKGTTTPRWTQPTAYVVALARQNLEAGLAALKAEEMHRIAQIAPQSIDASQATAGHKLVDRNRHQGAPPAPPVDRAAIDRGRHRKASTTGTSTTDEPIAKAVADLTKTAAERMARTQAELAKTYGEFRFAANKDARLSASSTTSTIVHAGDEIRLRHQLVDEEASLSVTKVHGRHATADAAIAEASKISRANGEQSISILYTKGGYYTAVEFDVAVPPVVGEGAFTPSGGDALFYAAVKAGRFLFWDTVDIGGDEYLLDRRAQLY